MMKKYLLLCAGLLALALSGFTSEVQARPPGLEPHAKHELRDVQLDRYVGMFKPSGSADVGGGWVKHVFDTLGGEGPICIAGTPLTVFHQQRAPKNLLIVLNGGGACLQDFYFCSILADEDPPGEGGVFADQFAGTDNPFADWSKMFVSYCDGSVFGGDNDVVDANFPYGPVRYHRGLRNVTAALDLARDLHPNAKNVVVSGISAGGYGVTGSAPLLFRLIFPPSADLFALNDSGPAISHTVFGSIPHEIDWQFAQYYPASCTDCSFLPGQGQGALIQWALDNDNGYRGALYSTDGDSVIQFFNDVPNQVAYRQLLLDVHDPINASHPDRYKRFIRSGSDAHTVLGHAGFYVYSADGVPFYQWAEDFVNDSLGWVDIVEDFVPVP